MADPTTTTEHDDHDHSDRHHDEHDHPGGLRGWLTELVKPHAHGYQATALDPAMSNTRGLWAVKVSLIALLGTAVFQVIIVAISGSVALLADTIHNFSDALTAIPLGLAFILARRARNRRYTYGYGRAEDLAGAVIVLMILLSAVEVFYQSFQKLLAPEPVRELGWVAAAAIIGFIGNEGVALLRIRVGRQIGSAALIADGLHARTDGFTSLGVLIGTIGVAAGLPWADPAIGLVIGVTILIVVWGAARDMWLRLMDAIDPEVTELVEQRAAAIEGVLSVHDVAVRWLGHRQRTELHVTVDCQLPTLASHRIAEAVRRELFHTLPTLAEVTVHIDPCECERSQGHHLADAHPASDSA
jgi:cation diffusion facilitator family transporter